MERELIVGECYSIKRITGKIVEFKLIEFDTNTKDLTFSELYYGGHGVFCNLSETEIKSISKIEKEGQRQ